MMMDIKKISSAFKDLEQPLRIVIEESTDGVISGFLLSKMFFKLGKKVVISYVNAQELKIALKENYSMFLIVFNNGVGDGENIIKIGEGGEINSEVLGIKAGNLCEITYCFCMRILSVAEYAYLVIGYSAGKKMSEYCRALLQECISRKAIIAVSGLRVFNNSTRDIIDTIRFSYDPCLKSVFGDGEKAAAFLNKAGIERIHEDSRRLIDLRKDEYERLMAEVLLDMTGVDDGNPFGTFFVSGEDDLRWMRFALDVCLRRHKIGVAYGLLSGNKEDFQKACEIADSYSLEMIKALKMIVMKKIKYEGSVCLHFGGELQEEIFDELIHLLITRRIFNVPALLLLAYSFDGGVLIHGKISKGDIQGFLSLVSGLCKVGVDDDGYLSGVVQREEEFLNKLDGWYIEKFINAL